MMAHKSLPSDLALLASISVRLGKNAAVVQGGGGNTSIKTNDGMWVKASGFFLRDVTPERGFVAVDDAAIRARLMTCHSEDDYYSLLNRSLRPGSVGRPSMETGFHALLGRVVLHSHPISVNLLCCSEEGQAIVTELFPDALWIPWALPGLDLTQKIFSEINKVNIKTIFLQNHGLIVSGDTAEEALEKHDQCCQKVAAHFGLAEDDLLQEGDYESGSHHVLFPDQAVYMQADHMNIGVARQETLQAVSSLSYLMKEIGLTPRYLTTQDALGLTQMEAEKFRQQVAGVAL